jgi:hypothetical protein
MNRNVKIAEQFGQLIASSNYVAAHSLLTENEQKIHSPDDLKKRFEKMTAYAPGPIRQVQVMEEFILTDWPRKRDGDIASVYVSLLGDAYVEAVSFILAYEAGVTRIRDLEWGRP